MAPVARAAKPRMSRNHLLFVAVVVVLGMLVLLRDQSTQQQQLSAASSPIMIETDESKPSTRRDFLAIASRTGTDKVRGELSLPGCLADPTKCHKPERATDTVNPQCRVFGHFYHSIYNRWIAPQYSTDDAEPFQFLEIGYYRGSGFDAYSEFMPRGELHSMEISCLPNGTRAEGLWPWGNFAAKNRNYAALRDNHRLHCGDAASFEFLQQVWTTEMHRPDAPPLHIVIDDAAHHSSHMALSVFFWFPKLAPGGLLFVEDIEPLAPPHEFRVYTLPQLLHDVHYCGNPDFSETVCFPTIQPLLKSIYCELNVCVLERNDEPAVYYEDKASNSPPKYALRPDAPCLFG